MSKATVRWWAKYIVITAVVTTNTLANNGCGDNQFFGDFLMAAITSFWICVIFIRREGE